MRRFVDALLIEAQTRVSLSSGQGNLLKTVYFGGGTPSMLSDRYLGRLFAGLKDIFDWSAVQEVSFETNPATFAAKRAVYFRELGISRVSLGVQSWDKEMLSLLGREHSPAQAAQSIALLREVGMPQVNVDLMFSIPGQSVKLWEKTLEQTLLQEPDHISAYNLTYEEDTDFYHRLGVGEWNKDEERDAEFFERSHNLLTQAGFRHYETSNFAREGCLSQHNLAYWMGADYCGIGPGAVSTVGRIRRTNESDTEFYIASVHECGDAPFLEELICEESYRVERVALLLRTDMGLPITFLRPEDSAFVSRLEMGGLAKLTSSKLILTERGRMLVDAIALELI